MLRKILHHAFDALDINEKMTSVAMETPVALRRIAARGIEVSTVIDIGASNGAWSGAAMKFFPDAQYLLIEAQQVHEPGLKGFTAARANAQYVLKAVGEEPGTIFFDAAEPFAGRACREAAPGLVEIPVTSVDHEIASRNLPGPYLLKFDVHGFELPILRGAEKALAETNLLVMECYNFEIADDMLMFPEMCRYMLDRGFRVIDMSEPLWREKDQALWQMDFFFVRADRHEFQSNDYR
jgi:FkbM family methyltransferase